LDSFGLGILPDGENDIVTLRFLQNHLRDVEERIGSAGHLDLSGQGLDPFLLGHQRKVHVWQRRWGFPALPVLGPARPAPVAAVWTGTTLAWRSVGGAARGRSSPITAWAATFGPLAREAIAPRRSRPAAIAAAVGSFLFAFVFGVLGGRGLFLRPSGQKQLFQVEFVIR
jgi:hypothetical protein